MNNTYNINNNLDRIKVMGRYVALEDGSVTCDNVCGGIAFNAKVNGEVKLNLSTKFGWVSGDIMLEQYFALFIDGVRQERLMIKGEKDSLTEHSMCICKHIEGEHLFEIIRSNEAMQCQMNIHSVEIEGELCHRPEDKKLLIEFVGDSITAGYGNLGEKTDIELANAGRYSDGTQTYAYLTKLALDADYTGVCASGMAFSYGLGEHPVSWFYSNVSCFRNSEDKFDFARKADVVVVHLGTNDWDNCPRKGFEFDDLREYVKPVISLIRRHRPGVKIVWTYGMMNFGYAESIELGLKDLGGEENGLYFCRLPYDDTHRGGHWHPSLLGHKNAAEILTEYLKKVL